MTRDGLFITFEGIDGAGKSTHIERLASLFRSRGSNVVLTREPGGTPLAEKLRGLVLSESMDPLTEALLMFAGRRDHLLEVIEPALARGDVVLCDRFTDATFAYQGFGREFDCVALQSLESLVQRTPSLPAPKIRQPDVTLWFDVDPAVAASRLAGVRVPDRFEAQPQEFFARVSKGYAWRMQQYRARFARINAEQGLEKVWQEVEAALRQRGFLP